MKINTIKELEAVLKLCRKQGVTDIKIDGIELHLAPITKSSSKSRVFTENPLQLPVITPYSPGGITESTPVAEAVQIATDTLTDEELLFYSARQEPGTEAGPQ